jgi:molybdenum cofactor cytidylyltransferase
VNGSALSVLIPAAGASRRLGQPKQLLRYRGETLIQRAIRLAASLAPLEIIVVIGANRDSVAAAIDACRRAGSPADGVREVFNPDWGGGLGGSIARGADALSPGARGVMVMLCDQWRICRRDLQKLFHTWQSDTDRIVCAQASGRLGPPAIFPATCFADLRKLTGDHGAREVLSAHADLVRPVEIPAAAADLDTQADLAALHSAESEANRAR